MNKKNFKVISRLGVVFLFVIFVFLINPQEVLGVGCSTTGEVGDCLGLSQATCLSKYVHFFDGIMRWSYQPCDWVAGACQMNSELTCSYFGCSSGCTLGTPSNITCLLDECDWATESPRGFGLTSNNTPGATYPGCVYRYDADYVDTCDVYMSTVSFWNDYWFFYDGKCSERSRAFCTAQCFACNTNKTGCDLLTGYYPDGTYWWESGVDNLDCDIIDPPPPPITLSCSALPNPAGTGQEVLFTASISGGGGNSGTYLYYYIWSGDCLGSGDDHAACTNTFYTAGTKTVTVSTSWGSQEVTATCSVEVSDECDVISNDPVTKVNQACINKYAPANSCDWMTIGGVGQDSFIRPKSTCIAGKCETLNKGCFKDQPEYRCSADKKEAQKANNSGCLLPNGCFVNNVWNLEATAPPPIKIGARCLSSGALQKQIESSNCKILAVDPWYDFSDKETTWVLEDSCAEEGNGTNPWCDRTTVLRCAGAVPSGTPWSGATGNCPASVEEVWQCAQCINNNECKRWPEWRLQFMGACCDRKIQWPYCVGKDIRLFKLTYHGVCVDPSTIPSFIFPACSLKTGTPTNDIITTCPFGCRVSGSRISCYGSCEAGTTQPCGTKCGTQTCSSNLAWGTCQNQGTCSPGQTQNCPGGGVRTCNNSCQWERYANCQQFYNTCSSQQCTQVLGVGTDDCQVNDDCVDHTICNEEQCILAPGPGTNECTDDIDCIGAGPTAEYLEIPPVDYCINPPGCGLMTFQWEYQSSNNVNEKQFYFQIDDNFDFSSPEVDTFVGNLNNPSGTINSQAVLVKPIDSTEGGNYLSYGATYYWRVKVWDKNDRSSVWVEDLSGFDTFSHPFPAPNFDFSDQTGFKGSTTASLLSVIEPGAPVNFFDDSACYNLDETIYRCQDSSSNTYTWTFGDGETSYAPGNVTHTYAVAGTYLAELEICDELGYCCGFSSTVSVGVQSGSGIPLWKEINPF